MKIDHLTLKNNLETIFIDLPGSMASTTQIWFRAGSALEAQEDYGIAHFLEHMFFKGTKTRPGPTLASEVEAFGGEINAFTSFDYTCYYINGPITHLEQSMHILLDMVSHPEFKDEDILPEREVVFEEYRRALDNPYQYSFKELQNNCFLGGYQHQILGTEETIKKFHREQLVHFRNKHYNSKNSFFVVAGDLSKKHGLKEIVEKYEMPNGEESYFSPFQLNEKNIFHIHTKSTKQAILNIVIQAKDCKSIEGVHEDLAINALGSGESSRLHKTLVLDSGLASSVSSSTMFFRGAGVHMIRVAAPSDAIPPILEKIAILFEEIYCKGFSVDEVQKIKNQYTASKIYEKESIESFAFSLGHSYAQTSDFNFDDKFIDLIKKASKPEVNYAYREILRKNLHLELQLPVEDKNKVSNAVLKKFMSEYSSICKKGDEKSRAAIKRKIPVNDRQTSIIELKNGIKFLHRENKLTPTFAMHAYIKGGLTEENKNNNGIYHLLSNMLNKGHSGIPAEVVKSDLETLSASLGNFSGKNSFGLTLHGQSEHFEHLIKHFFGALLAPNFEKKFFNLELKLAKRSLDNLKEDPTKQCFNQFNSLVFHGHPYSMNPMGSYTSLKNMSLKAVQSLMKSSIKNREMLISFCGAIALDDVLESLAPYIEKLPARATKKTVIKKIKPIVNENIFRPFKREQTQIVMGLPAFKMGDKRDLFLKILTNHLSGQSSDLFVEVRDRQGLCYAVQPIHFNALEGGYWGIYIGCGQDKTQKSMDAIKGIINDLAQNGLSLEEFQKIKSSLEGQNLLSLQTNEDYTSTYSIFELYNFGVDYYYQSNEMLSKISLDEMNSFLKNFLSKKFNEVIFGPAFK